MIRHTIDIGHNDYYNHTQLQLTKTVGITVTLIATFVARAYHACNAWRDWSLLGRTVYSARLEFILYCRGVLTAQAASCMITAVNTTTTTICYDNHHDNHYHHYR